MHAAVRTLRLEAVTQVEADALARVLQLFRGRNVVPRRVNAERICVPGTTTEVLQIEIEVEALEMSSDAMRLIAAKVAQMPIALSAIFFESHLDK